MVHAARHNHELPRVEPYVVVSELEQQPPFHHEEQLVLAIVVMPHELALELGELDVRVVDLSHDLRIPEVSERLEFPCQVHALHGALLRTRYSD